jgi:AcrR family transcriptional regulator
MTREAVLDAAERLFYTRGVQAVGMAEVRTASGVSLKRLYQLFPSKDALLLAFLDRRDVAWRGRLAAYVAGRGNEPLAVFDWLALWVREPDFRGCAWINVFGELGAVSPAVLDRVRAHKAAFRAYLRTLSPAAADQLMLLFEGATVTAAIMGDSEPAGQAKAAAARILSPRESRET